MSFPFASVTSYSPRLRQYANAILIPVLPATQIPAARTTKRGTAAVNYAENDAEEEDYDDSDSVRRPTGLRSLRRDEIHPDLGPTGEKIGTEILAPKNVQPNYREWVMRRRPRFLYD